MNKGRLISCILAVLLVVSLVPAAAFAADSPTGVPVDHFFAHIDGEDEDVDGVSYMINKGDALELKVVAGTDSGALSYSWHIEGAVGQPPIAGANGPSYLTGPINESITYRCEVQDDHGGDRNLIFEVTIDNGLTASVKGTQDQQAVIETEPGKAVTMEVDASANEGALTYEWLEWVEADDGGHNEWKPIQGAASAAYTVNAEYTGRYTCNVKDMYGNVTSVWFEIAVSNSLYARAKDANNDHVTLSVAEGESVFLEVEAGSGDGIVFYQWFDGNGQEIEGAVSATYTTPAFTGPVSYDCIVSDKYGNTHGVTFDIVYDSGLTVTKNASVEFDDNWVYAKPGETITLSVEATTGMGEITYEWIVFDLINDEPIDLGAQKNKASITVTVPQNSNISASCDVSDGKGEPVTVWFMTNVSGLKTEVHKDSTYEVVTLYVEKGGSIPLDMEASVTRGGISYEWSKEAGDGFELIAGEDKGCFTVTDASEDSGYLCSAKDDYGLEFILVFNLIVQDGSVKVNKADTYDANGAYFEPIFASKADPSFKPAATLTSAEAARIINVIVRAENTTTTSDDIITPDTVDNSELKTTSASQMEIVWSDDVSVPPGTPFPVTITFAVPNVSEDQDVFVYHYNETTKEWELVGTGKGSSVTAVFDKLSPVAIVKKVAGAAGGSAAASAPQTGDSSVAIYGIIAGVALIAIIAIIVIGIKRRR